MSGWMWIWDVVRFDTSVLYLSVPLAHHDTLCLKTLTVRDDHLLELPLRRACQTLPPPASWEVIV